MEECVAGAHGWYLYMIARALVLSISRIRPSFAGRRLGDLVLVQRYGRFRFSHEILVALSYAYDNKYWLLVKRVPVAIGIILARIGAVAYAKRISKCGSPSSSS